MITLVYSLDLLSCDKEAMKENIRFQKQNDYGEGT